MKMKCPHCGSENVRHHAMYIHQKQEGDPDRKPGTNIVTYACQGCHGYFRWDRDHGRVVPKEASNGH